MNCLDCHPIQNDAVAICGRCGAGLCVEHLIESEEPLTFVAPINARVSADPPARRLRCAHCAAAEYAQEHHIAGARRGAPAEKKKSSVSV
jgi:hypothetical protein